MIQHCRLSVLLLLLVLSVYCDQRLVRQTKNGPVEGIEQTSSLGQKYYAFKGIPFAELPITGLDQNGEKVDRRFKAPIPLKRTWNENLKVQNFQKACIANSNFVDKWDMSEDCLYVNVYVPARGLGNKTVLVWIHGGGFSVGDAGNHMYGPDFLLTRDNIVVTVAYRLGIFGFLNLGFGEYTGNMGLKDQQLALKWIYENIENFSGNRNEILLFGESAGGASVGHHILNEKSKRYFNRAFLSSSSALSFYALDERNHLQMIKKFAKINDEQKLIEYLRTEDSQVLVGISPDYLMNLQGLHVPWAPTIEHPDDVDAFMTKGPEEIYQSDSAPALDVLFSFNSKESIAFDSELIGYREPLIKENVEESDLELPFKGFNKTAFPKEYKQALTLLKAAYYPDTNSDNDIERANFDLLSDIIFCDSIIKAIIFQTNVNNREKRTDKALDKNTFLFRFSMDTDINMQRVNHTWKYEGATHADDLCYMFHCHDFDSLHLYDKHLQQKDATYDAIMRVVQMITNFARFGNPSIEQDTPFKSCKSSNEVYCQQISNNPKSTVTTNIKEQTRFDTWREVERIYRNSRNMSSNKNDDSSEATTLVYGSISTVLLNVCIIFVTQLLAQ